jgi:hypothetical protein
MKVKIILFNLLSIFSTLFIYDDKKIHSDFIQQKVLNIEGLQNAALFDYIYRGHFENIEIKRDSDVFYILLNNYINVYANKCAAFLPNSKVKIMEDVCQKERVTTNGFGEEIDRTCIEWKEEWTGLYAKKELYDAKNLIQNLRNKESLSGLLDIITNDNAAGNSVDLYHKAKSISQDIKILFQNNNCNSAALMRFEENLLNFATNQSGVRHEQKSKFEVINDLSAPKGNQNFSMLINDLIDDQSKNWMMNRYHSNSISNLDILSYDDNNYPLTIKANYVFSGFSGESKGWVKLVFKNGKPDCIYFWDFPRNCKKPNSNIVYEYQIK